MYKSVLDINYIKKVYIVENKLNNFINITILYNFIKYILYDFKQI